MHEQHGSGLGYLLTVVSIAFAWISKLTMDQIAWIISIASGVLACTNFVIRILLDLPRLRKPKVKQDEQVVDEPKQNRCA